ncbi:MAG: type IV pilus secretin PilQ [Desulforegulaceae bacterium]|nr:type IV pilus secretin PilQ [Desulforegulaceae bacterium]
MINTKTALKLLGLVLIFIFAFSSCSSKETEVGKDNFFKEWKAKAEISRGYSPPDPLSEEITEETIFQKPGDKEVVQVKPQFIPGGVDLDALSGMDELPDSLMTIKMRNVEVATLLRALAKGAGKNIILSQNISGQADIHAENTPWKEIFASILRSHGLTYNIIGNTIRIKTLEDMKRDFEIENQFIDQKQKRKSLKQQEIITKVFFLKYSDPETSAELIRPFISKTNSQADSIQKAVAIDKRNNAIIVHASAQDIAQCEDLLKKTDKPVKQILIEAQIVETSKDTARELGIQWGGVGKGKNNHYITTGTIDPSSHSLDTPVNPEGGWGANFGVDVAEKGFSLGYIYEDLGVSLISAQLTALENEGRLNILSRPSISTLNNSTAIIESGSDVPYQTVEDGEVSTEWKKAVLKLEVVPHIIDDKTLKVKIKTNKDELDWSKANISQGNPTVITKSAETEMILFDGETTVIGGLNKETQNKSSYGVPFLKDIPLLGYLFKGSEKNNGYEEILIFITPHILKSHNQYSEISN